MNVVTLFGYMLTGGFLISLAFGGGDLVTGVRKSQVASTNREQAIAESRTVLADQARESAEIDLLVANKDFVAAIVLQRSPAWTKDRPVFMRSSFSVDDRVTVGGERNQVVPENTLIVSGTSQLGIVKGGVVKNPFNTSSPSLPILSSAQVTAAIPLGKFRDYNFVSTSATGTAIKR